MVKCGLILQYLTANPTSIRMFPSGYPLSKYAHGFILLALTLSVILHINNYKYILVKSNVILTIIKWWIYYLPFSPPLSLPLFLCLSLYLNWVLSSRRNYLYFKRKNLHLSLFYEPKFLLKIYTSTIYVVLEYWYQIFIHSLK